MDEVLTIAQIEAQFRSEWVLTEEPRTNQESLWGTGAQLVTNHQSPVTNHWS